MTTRRVAITGIGCVSALGVGREVVWQRLVEGRCGIRPLTLFDTRGYRSHLAAELPDFDPDAWFTPREHRHWSRCDAIAVLAASEALDDARWQTSGVPGTRVGVMLGAGAGDLLRNERYLRDLRTRGIAKAKPSDIFSFFSSTPVDVVGRRFGFTGPRQCVVAACSSSAIAIGHALDAIRSGAIDAAVTGGADVLCRLTFSGFNALRLVDTEPCRPFDAGRAGMTIGEASAVLVLEDYEHACRRGVHIYAELAGHGVTCEAYHPTSPEPDGHAVAATIRAALTDAAVAADLVDHVNAHGTGTPHNDRAESRAFHHVFGARARQLPVTSIKAMVGHCLGAAGAIEAAALALTIDRGTIPPTIGHRATDPECDVDVVANVARRADVHCGVSTSLAFGGNNAALVMRRASGQ